MVDNTKVIIVAGMGLTTRAIGQENGLIWHVPADMKRFKALTFGHPIIMGRKTFESIVGILGKPLPGRTNIVITKNSDYRFEGATVVTSLDAAFKNALKEHPTEIHIGGGAEIYRQALPWVDELYLTLFDDNSIGDTNFPEFEKDFIIKTEHESQEHNGLKFQWVDYVRNK